MFSDTSSNCTGGREDGTLNEGSCSREDPRRASIKRETGKLLYKKEKCEFSVAETMLSDFHTYHVTFVVARIFPSMGIPN